MTRRQRGSRAVRSGPTREGRKVLDAMNAEPLPEDRQERYVEETRRSFMRAAWADQRLPQNKRKTSEKMRAWERAAALHLERDHGISPTQPRTTRYVVDGKDYYTATRAHEAIAH